METTNLEKEEREWIETQYRGNSMREFTIKAVIAGGLVGALLIASNVFVGLKTGIFAGGSILSAILSFVILRSFRASFSLLENNIAQTVASAAATIGVVVSVLPALIMMGYEFTIYQIFPWLLFVSFLGVLFAVTLRKQTIVTEKLPFPSGTACAATISAMHAGEGEAMKKGKMLGFSGLLAAIIIWFRDGIPSLIPATTFLPGKISGTGFNQLLVGFNWSPLFFGVGMLIGPRIGISLLIGTFIGWGTIGPVLGSAGIIETVGYGHVSRWTMWPAIALMIAAGFTSLIMKGGIILRSLRSMKGSSFGSDDNLELPFVFWFAGIILCILVISIVMRSIFMIPAWVSIVSIPVSFILASVAVRAYGETDVNPAGTMGHASQITFGVLAPGKLLTNVMTGGVSASTANSAADIMGDLKTGYLLGATPRRQTYAQFIGVIIGACVALPVFNLLISTYDIGSAELPAPAGVSWSGLANVLVGGFRALPPYSDIAVYAGIIIGILLTVGSNTKIKNVVPSPIGIGIAMILPAMYSLPIFLGSMITVALKKSIPGWWGNNSLYVASGLIAGEAVLALIIIILRTTGVF